MQKSFISSALVSFWFRFEVFSHIHNEVEVHLKILQFHPFLSAIFGMCIQNLHCYQLMAQNA